MEYDPEEIYKIMTLTGYDYAEKKAEADFLSDEKRIVRARCFVQHETKMTATAAHEHAYADPLYKEACIKSAEATGQALKAQALMNATKALSDGRRTQESTQRAAMGRQA